MKLLACIAAASVVSARNMYSTETISAFESFKVKFDKVYASKEHETIALSAFADNMVRAETRNALGGAKHGVTKFMDLTPADFKAQYLNYNSKTRGESRFVQGAKELPRAAPSIDWTNSTLPFKVVTPVKNQRVCGSCWAFSATEQLESVYAMTNKVDAIPFSTQQVVACDRASNGCGGGDSVSAFRYLKSFGGIMAAADYKDTSSFTGITGKCKAKKGKVVPGTEIDQTVFCLDECTSKRCPFHVASELKAKQCITSAPQSICVNAESWQTYQSGVLSAAQCGGHGANDLDHCVQVVGYHQDAGSDASYYIVRNSWATDWGLDGLIHLALGKNTCGILDEMTTVTLK